MNDGFRRFARRISESAGSPLTFALASAAILVWAVTGPLFHYSVTWQLIINTGTGLVTFLMVFLIQNTQNREAAAMHLKVDELLRAVEGARTGMVDLENCSDAELEHLQEAFRRLKRFAPPVVAEIVDEFVEEAEEVQEEREAAQRSS